MEIDALSSALTAVTSSTPGTLTNAASVAMLGNAMDLNEVMAESTIKMMDKFLLKNKYGKRMCPGTFFFIYNFI